MKSSLASVRKIGLLNLCTSKWQQKSLCGVPADTSESHRALGPSEAGLPPKVSGSGRLEVSCPKANAGPLSSSPCNEMATSHAGIIAPVISVICNDDK